MTVGILPRTALLTATLLLIGTSGAFGFEVSSSSVSDGKWDYKFFADKIAGCDGGNISPAVSRKDAPAGTRSFAVKLFDRDAPTGGGWWHWQVWNIAPTVTGFEEGQLPAGVSESKSDIGQLGYLGLCPP